MPLDKTIGCLFNESTSLKSPTVNCQKGEFMPNIFYYLLNHTLFSKLKNSKSLFFSFWET